MTLEVIKTQIKIVDEQQRVIAAKRQSLSSDRSMDPLNDRLLAPPHQPPGLVRWGCDDSAFLSLGSVLTCTKEHRGVLRVLRSNALRDVVKGYPKPGLKGH